MDNTPSYVTLLLLSADEADADPQNGKGWDRDSRIDLRRQTYMDWIKYKSSPQPIQGLTSEDTALILSDICRINGIDLAGLATVPEVTFGYAMCISTNTEPMWRGGWKFRAGSLSLKWDRQVQGSTVKGCALRALAQCARTPAHGRAWVGSLRDLLGA